MKCGMKYDRRGQSACRGDDGKIYAKEITAGIYIYLLSEVYVFLAGVGEFK